MPSSDTERVKFSTDIAQVVKRGDIQFIAFGTPDEDCFVDRRYVFAVARDIGRNMNTFKVIVDESKIPVGTADKVRGVIAEEFAKRGADLQFAVISNLPLLKEGTAVEDFIVKAGIG